MSTRTATVKIEGDAASVVREADQAAKALKKLDRQVQEANRKQIQAADPLFRQKALQKSFIEGQARGLDMLSEKVQVLGSWWGALRNPMVATALVGGGAVAGLGVAINAVGKASVVASANFESAMANVKTLLPTQDIFHFDKALIDMGRRLGQSPKDLADGLYQVISAGVEAGDALGVLEVGSKAAKAGLTDTFTAVDGITTILNAYSLKATEAERVSDMMFKTVEKGKVTFPDLAKFVGQAAPLAAQAGVRPEELLSSVAVATAKGIRPSTAFEGLRSAIANVIKPTEEARKTAKRMGLQFNVAALQSKGLAAFLEDVRVKSRGNTEALSILFGDVSGLNTILAVTGGGGDTFARTLDDVTDSAGSTTRAFDIQRETFNEHKKSVDANWEAIKIKLGNGLLPVLNEGLVATNKWLDRLQDPPRTGLEAFAEQLRTTLGLTGPENQKKVETFTKHLDEMGRKPGTASLSDFAGYLEKTMGLSKDTADRVVILSDDLTTLQGAAKGLDPDLPNATTWVGDHASAAGTAGDKVSGLGAALGKLPEMLGGLSSPLTTATGKTDEFHGSLGLVSWKQDNLKSKLDGFYAHVNTYREGLTPGIDGTQTLADKLFGVRGELIVMGDKLGGLKSPLEAYRDLLPETTTRTNALGREAQITAAHFGMITSNANNAAEATRNYLRALGERNRIGGNLDGFYNSLPPTPSPTTPQTGLSTTLTVNVNGAANPAQVAEEVIRQIGEKIGEKVRY